MLRAGGRLHVASVASPVIIVPVAVAIAIPVAVIVAIAAVVTVTTPATLIIVITVTIAVTPAPLVVPIVALHAIITIIVPFTILTTIVIPLVIVLPRAAAALIITIPAVIAVPALAARIRHAGCRVENGIGALAHLIGIAAELGHRIACATLGAGRQRQRDRRQQEQPAGAQHLRPGLLHREMGFLHSWNLVISHAVSPVWGILAGMSGIRIPTFIQ